jgi:hypothetical protein
MTSLALIALLAVGTSPTTWTRTLTKADGPAERLTLVIPFYEGVRIDAAPATLAEIGQRSMRLAYPGVLSAPFVAWRLGEGAWQVALVDRPGPWPAELELEASGDSLRITLRSLAGRKVETASIDGDLAALARAVRERWKPVGTGHPLAERFRRQNFYVHQFVPATGKTIRYDWELPALVERMKHEAPGTIQFVYGYDPSGVDLAGEYFWSPGATEKVRAVVGANRQLAHLNWLNLRTWKRAIPALGIERPVSAAVQAMLKLYPTGSDSTEQFRFQALDACLGAADWQRSRLVQFDRLADLGFKVVQLDEFPIPRFWHTAPCQATSHLHRPNDIVDEWTQIDLFLRKLSDRARQRGVLLTCEEPSAALVPYVAGYIDRQFNDSIELYRVFRTSPRAAPIPLFSMVFADLVTPYTDTDESAPVRQPPPGWIEQYKISPPRGPPSRGDGARR